MNTLTLETMIHSYDYFLFDCDGTLWSGDLLLPDADQLVNSLTSAGKFVLFVSNNATVNTDRIIQKASHFGMTIPPEQFISSGHVLVDVLQKRNLLSSISSPSRALVFGEQALVSLLESNGLQTCGSPGPDPKDDLFRNSRTPPDDVNIVIAGFDSQLTYSRIARAQRVLQSPSVLYIVTNTDPAIPAEGSSQPGAGIVVAAISTAAEREPDIICGKPSPHMFQYVINRIRSIDQNAANNSEQSIKNKMLFIGDRLDTDIEFGIKNGFNTLLVLTGVTSSETAQLSPMKPTYTLSTFSELFT
ncbi:putative Pyridoxal phosphate phosphatase [Blattamonas nauphoetae]|uniref:Pyridoxal phosphate phosphatase n=1 Tax=Blattamonas nauphoetae TaxID=2049346 RepID=A0ABQ9YHS4_9EUKA|nr:putative Pyridoxal phosphate phosphatase [Blattamonas nauphoetae]